MRMERTLLIAAVGLLLIFVVVMALVGGGDDKADQVPATTDVVMVLQPIDRGEVINAERLRLVPYPTAELIEGLMFLSFEDVVGKFALYDLEQGVIITKNMLVENADLIPTDCCSCD
jgi:Flp pilus assembly protein CpaB